VGLKLPQMFEVERPMERIHLAYAPQGRGILHGHDQQARRTKKKKKKKKNLRGEGETILERLLNRAKAALQTQQQPSGSIKMKKGAKEVSSMLQPRPPSIPPNTGKLDMQRLRHSASHRPALPMSLLGGNPSRKIPRRPIREGHHHWIRIASLPYYHPQKGLKL
jgi:hypothetical protein